MVLKIATRSKERKREQQNGIVEKKVKLKTTKKAIKVVLRNHKQ